MKTYLITGVTGYIGHMLIERILSHREEDLCFYLPVRDFDKADTLVESWTSKGIVGDITLLDKSVNQTSEVPIRIYKGTGAIFIFEKTNIEDCTLDKIRKPIEQAHTGLDYIIHMAAPTSSKYMMDHPEETYYAIKIGTRNMLEIARAFSVKSMVNVSSMEAYGVAKDIGHNRSEEELGSIDASKPRASYPLGKRDAEKDCLHYAEDYDVPVKTARLAQCFGRGVLDTDNRVYMQFARAAMKGEDIVLKTKGLSLGNYCAIDDVIDAILILLERGENGQIYNVVNENTIMTIKEMADFVAKEIAPEVSGKEIEVRIEEESRLSTGYAEDTGTKMSSEKLRSLNWEPNAGLYDMYMDAIESIKNSPFRG